MLQGDCEVNEGISSEIEPSPVAVLCGNLVLALRIHPGFPDHVKPGPENLLLKKMYAEFLHFFFQVSQVLGMRKGTKVSQIVSQRIRANKQWPYLQPAPDDSPTQRL